MLLAILIGAITLMSGGNGDVSGGVTLHAGTTLHTVLARTVDAATAPADGSIVFRLAAPYPHGAPGLAGAKVIAHISDVTAPAHGSARIGFIFYRITFADGESEPIAAYVDDPAFTRREPADFAPVSAAALPPGAPTLGGPKQPATLVQINLGSKPFRPTGGWIYATHAAADIVLQAGTSYVLELARGITVPASTTPRLQAR